MHRGLVLALSGAIFAACGVASVRGSTVTLLGSNPVSGQSFSANTAGTVFSLTDIQPAGSGVFNPFVRIDKDQHDHTQEQGYNSSNTSGTLDDQPNGPANPQILLKNVVDVNGNINLALDYNEPGQNKGPIVLEDLQLVVSTNSNRSGPAAPSSFTPTPIALDAGFGEIQVYHMLDTTRTDSGHVGEHFNIGMDAADNLASGNGGSGQADLLVRINLASIPNLTSLLDDNHYLYVYSRFSQVDAGYEEWRIESNNGVTFHLTPVPLPAAFWAGGSLLAGLAGMRLMRRKV